MWQQFKCMCGCLQSSFCSDVCGAAFICCALISVGHLVWIGVASLKTLLNMKCRFLLSDVAQLQSRKMKNLFIKA